MRPRARACHGARPGTRRGCAQRGRVHGPGAHGQGMRRAHGPGPGLPGRERERAHGLEARACSLRWSKNALEARACARPGSESVRTARERWRAHGSGARVCARNWSARPETLWPGALKRGRVLRPGPPGPGARACARPLSESVLTARERAHGPGARGAHGPGARACTRPASEHPLAPPRARVCVVTAWERASTTRERKHVILALGLATPWRAW